MPEQDWYYVKNWYKFQHYKHRTPPWIKVHRSILSDPNFQSLRPEDRYRLICLWLAASEREGRVPCAWAALRPIVGYAQESQCRLLLARLEDKGFISKDDIRGSRQALASKMLAQSRDRDRVREETPIVPLQGTTEKLKKSPTKTNGYSEGFLLFWGAYPRKTAKGAAWRAWRKLRPTRGLGMQIIASVEAHLKSEDWTRDSGQFIPHPATFLNQSRWEDEIKPEGMTDEKLFNLADEARMRFAH